MIISAKATLRQLLTLPFVALILITVAVIGWLSYNAGSKAIDELSDRVLVESVGRIKQAVEHHMSGSAAVLDVAFPDSLPAPKQLSNEAQAIQDRLWQATTFHRNPNNYAYYGDRNGHFIGVWRHSDTDAELRLRTDAANTRTVYQFTGINGELRSPLVEPDVFDPRDRPWYRAAIDRKSVV